MSVADLPNVHVLDSLAVKKLLTVVRDKTTPQDQYVRHADRAMRILAEEALARLPSAKAVQVETPCGPYDGWGADENNLCAISIVRSGNCLLEVVRQVVNCSVGHVLVQRDESDPEKKPIYFYHKLPPDVKEREILLVDPMIGTAGSAKAAMKCLLEAGVDEAKVVFVNVVSCPEGIKALLDAHPKVTVVTAALDPKMNEHKFIDPGLGDFGDRYYNTGDFCDSQWQRSPLLATQR